MNLTGLERRAINQTWQEQDKARRIRNNRWLDGVLIFLFVCGLMMVHFWR